MNIDKLIKEQAIESDSRFPDDEFIVEGDVLVVIKYKGTTYATAYKFDNPILGNKIKSSIEATQRVLIDENFINR